MTVDEAVETIQRAAKASSDGSDDALAAAVRELAVHELALLWQRFLPYVQSVLDRKSDGAAAEHLVRALFRGSAEARPSPLVAEQRLVDLAARLRRHDGVGRDARALLAAAPLALAIAAVERYPFEPVLPRVPMPEPRDFLARYRKGQRGVWNELVENALAVAQHAELRDEAREVAGELMKRVRHNADVVRSVLRDAGATLADECAPAGDEELARVGELAGPLPLALDAFWRVVGSIALAAPPETDGAALVVHGTRELGSALDRHERAIAASHREIVGPLALDVIAPAATIELPPPTPADAVDPRVHGGRHRLRFVEYLRFAFRWGGLPDLEDSHRQRAALLAKLRADLQDF